MGEINQYRTIILTKNDYRLQPITKRFVYDRKKINFLNTYCDFPTFIFIFSLIKHLRRIETRLFVKMRSAILFCIFTVLFAVVSARIDPKNLKCLVCRTTFEELNDAIKKVDKWKTVDVGNFRMDASGNTMQDKVPAHRSAVYISEVIDGICKKMDDYVRVYYKATGKLAIMQLISPGGGMNPEFSKTKFVTDDDLNKSLEYYCERMFEENEDEITSLYKNRPDDDVMPDAEREICFDHAQYCEEWMLPTSEDTTWTMEMEAEYVKVHGPDPYGFGGGLPQMSQMPEVNEEYDEVPDTDDFDVPADKDEL